MAKKKTAETANIKAAPVLRDGNSNDPVVTKSYSVRDDWKDKDIVNYVAFKSVDGEVQDLTVNGQPAGGGGGMRTVSVNCTNDSQNDYSIYIPNIDSNAPGIIYSEILLDADFEADVPVILGENGTIGVADITDTRDRLSVSGNISILSHEDTRYELEITGNGSIHVE